MQNVSLNLCKNWSLQEYHRSVGRNAHLVTKFMNLFNQIEGDLGSWLNTSLMCLWGSVLKRWCTHHCIGGGYLTSSWADNILVAPGKVPKTGEFLLFWYKNNFSTSLWHQMFTLSRLWMPVVIHRACKVLKTLTLSLKLFFHPPLSDAFVVNCPVLLTYQCLQSSDS